MCNTHIHRSLKWTACFANCLFIKNMSFPWGTMRPRLHTIFTNANVPTDPSQFCGNKSPCRTRPVLNVKFSAARYPCTRINQPWTENTKLIRYLQKWLTAAPRFSAGGKPPIKNRTWTGLMWTQLEWFKRNRCPFRLKEVMSSKFNTLLHYATFLPQG